MQIGWSPVALSAGDQPIIESDLRVPPSSDGVTKPRYELVRRTTMGPR
jgi:hypothetical protein